MAETKPAFTTFGELLKHLRQRAQLTQDEFGLAVGYSRAHIARLESNQRLPDAGAVKARFFQPLNLKPDSDEAVLLEKLATSTRVRTSAVDEHETAPVSQSIPNNLPYELTSFIGRERALAELERLLPTTRLMTLTGTGGTGKTRLALKLAEHVMEDYGDGVLLVELESLSDSAMVPQAILAALGRPGVSAQQATQTLIHWLREKRVLLFIDNCEHVIDACAQVVDGLLRGCRNITVLTTSREALGIPGELSWRVPSLQVPDSKSPPAFEVMSQYESMQLFVERAAFAEPAFKLTAENAPAVLHVCKRLDGIPLAIELAAARVKALTPSDIAARLDDRFRLLAGGSRTALPRQQTLRAAIDWSYHLLSEPERLLLSRLAVFTGGWTLAAAEHVCAGGEIERVDVIGLLSRLVDKSLVVMDDTGIETRYFLLETIRHFSLEKLIDAGNGAAMRDQHLDYFLQLGAEVMPKLEGFTPANQNRLIMRLATHMDNIRSACDWAVESGNLARGLDLLEYFYVLFVVRNAQNELIHHLEKLLEHPKANRYTRRQAYMYSLMGLMQIRHDDLDNAWATMEKISEIGQALSSNEIMSWAEGGSDTGYFWIALARGDATAARLHFNRWIEIAPADLIYTDSKFSFYDRAYIERTMRAFLAYGQEDYKLAVDTWKPIYDRFAQSEYKIHSSGCARVLANFMIFAGDLDQAGAFLRESMIDNHTLGDDLAVAACLSAYAALALARRDMCRCATLLSACDAIQGIAQINMSWMDRQVYDKTLERLHRQIDHAIFQNCWEEGHSLTLEEAMVYALEAEPLWFLASKSKAS